MSKTRKPTMVGKYKTFDESLYNQHNHRGIAAVLQHLDEQGLYGEINDDLYGPDIVVYKGFRPSYYIEVEVRKNWADGSKSFPFSTLHIPERKAKFINSRTAMTLEFWSLSNDLTAAMITPDFLVLNSPLLETKNVHIASGELFYNVPTDELTYKDLRSGNQDQ
jgi:hypothetical protein